MTTRMTVFTATLVQDSALSVSGLDRESAADHPFAIVDGQPILVGRGLKGAAVAMARRFFDPLPRSVSEMWGEKSLQRSAWEFANATLVSADNATAMRAGVGILQKTGARAGGRLYDREVVPAGRQWALTFRVDWSIAPSEAEQAEGILGYILSEHWSKERCWLGGGAARGLGWCHVETLRAFRLDPAAYESWVTSGRKVLPDQESKIPVADPTRSWCFRTMDLTIKFGEYQPPSASNPETHETWGLDMLAIGVHQSDRSVQPMGDGAWAKPSWARPDAVKDIPTDRPILMDGDRPLLPGSSLRGPLRHAFSRAKRRLGDQIADPNAAVAPGSDRRPKPNADAAGAMFGTLSKSSQVLIKDARANKGWEAARLHMHAEDEFSGGSYGSAKRDAVRLLKAEFPIRIVVEGSCEAAVKPFLEEIDNLIALGGLGHLPIGGHKTRGAGWGRWSPDPSGWKDDGSVQLAAECSPAKAQPEKSNSAEVSAAPVGGALPSKHEFSETEVGLRIRQGQLAEADVTLGQAAAYARNDLGDRELVAWWCEPLIDLSVRAPPSIFGRTFPTDDALRVEEAAFFTDDAVWRVARTDTGVRWTFIEETPAGEVTMRALARERPVRLHGGARFAAVKIEGRNTRLREWHLDGELLGFTVLSEV